jgi:hypothetical protein
VLVGGARKEANLAAACLSAIDIEHYDRQLLRRLQELRAVAGVWVC